MFTINPQLWFQHMLQRGQINIHQRETARAPERDLPLTTPPTTSTPMEVRDVREARPVTMETMSSSWVTELWGNGGMLVLTGVKARGRGTCREHKVPQVSIDTSVSVDGGWWRTHLVVIAHEGSPGVLGPQEAVDQHGPTQREVKADVLLKVAAQLVTGQIVTETEAMPRNQLVHLLSDRVWQQRLQTLWRETQAVTRDSVYSPSLHGAQVIILSQQLA